MADGGPARIDVDGEDRGLGGYGMLQVFGRAGRRGRDCAARFISPRNRAPAPVIPDNVVSSVWATLPSLSRGFINGPELDQPLPLCSRGFRRKFVHDS